MSMSIRLDMKNERSNSQTRHELGVEYREDKEISGLIDDKRASKELVQLKWPDCKNEQLRRVELLCWKKSRVVGN